MLEFKSCRDKLDKVYDKLKFKRQEEAVLVADLQQIDGRLNNLASEQRGLATVVDELMRRKMEADKQVGGEVGSADVIGVIVWWGVLGRQDRCSVQASYHTPDY